MVAKLQRWCGKQKKYPLYFHESPLITYFSIWLTDKVFTDEVSQFLSQFTQNIGHIYMLNDKQAIGEQHKPWKLKKLST